MSSTSRHNGGGPAGTTAAYRGVPPSPTAAEAAQHPTSAPAKPASAFESGAPASIRPQLPPGHVPGQAFDPTYTAQLFQACAKHKEAVPLDVFLDGCTEIRGLIDTLGSAMSLASSDIDEKIRCVSLRANEYAERAGCAPAGAGTSSRAGQGSHEAPLSALTLQQLVSWEVEHGLAAKNDGKTGYVSASRSILRLMWFLDFVHVLISRLTSGPDVTLRSCAQDAYATALAPHHGWLLRKTIGAALLATPSRATFVANLERKSTASSSSSGSSSGGGGGRGMGTGQEKDLMGRLQDFLEHVGQVKGTLWQFYQQKHLVNLP